MHVAQTFRVTHPFHPWKGREFSLVTYRKNWGEARVFCQGDNGYLMSIPAEWTDVLPPDPLIAISQGRSPFRADDLLELAELLRRIAPQHQARTRRCVK
jgi:hypothetical protein